MVLTGPWSPQWAGLPQAAFSPSASARGGAAMQIGVLSGPTPPLLEPWWWSSVHSADHGVEGGSLLGGPGGSPC